jgi:transcriptional antiterminator RfaH
MTDDLRWHVVIANSRRELRAFESLKERGLTVYLPRLTAWTVHARRRIKVSRPLFPGYLFLGMPQGVGLWGLRSAIGVQGVLRVGQDVVTIRPKVIDDLRAAEDAGLFDLTVRPPPPFALGSSVRVKAGPFVGFAAKVLALPSTSRIRVVLERNGLPATFDMSDVEAA